MRRETLVSAAIWMALAGLPLCAQVPSQSGIAEVNGTKLYYEMAGSGHAMVLLHGEPWTAGRGMTSSPSLLCTTA